MSEWTSLFVSYRYPQLSRTKSTRPPFKVLRCCQTLSWSSFKMNCCLASWASLPTDCRCSISAWDRCVSRDRSFQRIVSRIKNLKPLLTVAFPLWSYVKETNYQGRRYSYHKHIWIISLNKTPILSASKALFSLSSSCIVVAISEQKSMISGGFESGQMVEHTKDRCPRLLKSLHFLC